MSDLHELYQEMILDHNRRPRNYRMVIEPTHAAEGFNPLCGDQLKVSVHVDDDRITDIGFQGEGCAISKASASLMTATGWRPGIAKSVALDPIVTTICRALVTVAEARWPSYVACTAEVPLVPKKPPLILKLVAPEVPCGMVSGEGPEITGRTALTTT